MFRGAIRLKCRVIQQDQDAAVGHCMLMQDARGLCQVLNESRAKLVHHVRRSTFRRLPPAYGDVRA